MLKKASLLINRKLKPFFLISSMVLALGTVNPASVNAQELHADNTMPVYPGGTRAIKDFINQNLQSPSSAVISGVSGIVHVNYIIDHDGKVKNIRVMQGLSPECDAEALRVTNLLKGWVPGRRQGKPVSITISMPVEFKFNKIISPATVIGKITEKTTGKVIEGALVIIKGTNVGSVTNETGSYRIDLPAESKELVILSVGYSPKEISIDYHSTINVDLETEVHVINFDSIEN